jgi:DNA-binding transcriptional MerR regulator
MAGQEELMTAQVAEIAGCHPNTVKRYEVKGLIKAKRDRNGFRRFTVKEAHKLKKMLAQRH